MRIEMHDEVALLRLESGKANAMNPQFLAGLTQLIEDARDRGARAIVLVGNGSIFSAGLDLPTLFPLDRNEMRGLIERFDETLLGVFNCPTPVVAAIDGHAIAGGCVLALEADVRLITDADVKIGLNEAQVGLSLPLAVFEELRSQVPVPSLVPIAFEGRLFTPREALAVGLVHEVVPAAGLLDRALAKGRELAALAPDAYAHIKALARAPANERIQARIAAENERWLDTWFSDEARRRIGEIVERLTSG